MKPSNRDRLGFTAFAWMLNALVLWLLLQQQHGVDVVEVILIAEGILASAFFFLCADAPRRVIRALRGRGAFEFVVVKRRRPEPERDMVSVPFEGGKEAQKRFLEDFTIRDFVIRLDEDPENQTP